MTRSGNVIQIIKNIWKSCRNHSCTKEITGFVTVSNIQNFGIEVTASDDINLQLFQY